MTVKLIAAAGHLSIATGIAVAGVPQFAELHLESFDWRSTAAMCISGDGQVIGGGISDPGGLGRPNEGPVFWAGSEEGRSPTTYTPGSAAEIRALTHDGRLGVGVTLGDPIAQAFGPIVWDLVLRQARGLPKTTSWATDAACGVNHDGTVVVGRNAGRAVAWIGNNLPTELMPGPNSTAAGVNADGSLIVGSFGPESLSTSTAFVWTAGSGPAPLPSPVPGATQDLALAVTPDGSTAVGYSGIDRGYGAMVRWHLAANGSATSSEILSPPGWYYGRSCVETMDNFPIAVSASGDVVGGTRDQRAIVWVEGHGLLDLATLYEALNPPPPPGPKPSDASYGLPYAVTGISADGRAIVGYSLLFDGKYYRPAAWRLTLPPRCDGDANFDGVVDTRDLVRLLASFGRVVPFGMRGDSNGDGTVDTSDLVRLIAAFGSVCPE